MKMRYQSKNNLTSLEKILLISASDAVCFLATILLLSTILFTLKVPINIYILPAAFLVTIIFGLRFAHILKADFFIRSISLFLMLIYFIVSVYVSGSVYDLSYDGQAYHQEAIVLLDRGWNPIYTTLTNEATANLERWLNHYPKGNWIIAANIYKLTRNIESGKMLSIFSAFIAFAFSLYGVFRLKINSTLKILISALFAINPVLLYQSLSYYIDGVLVSLLISLVFISVRIASLKEKFLFWPFIFISIILINTKLTAVVFFGALTFFFFLYLWINGQLKLSIWYIKITLFSIILGVLFLGFNPFITNFSVKGHPLWPAMGRGAYDYVETNTPENYWELSPPERLLVSIFSESSLARGKGKFGFLKSPVAVTRAELESFRQTNTKVGGFGPLFGLAFILTFAGLVIYQFSGVKIRESVISLFSVFIIFALAAVVPTSSVARYVPFVWWIPIMTLLFLFSKKRILTTIVGAMILVVLFINIVLVGASNIPYNLKQSSKLYGQLQALPKDETLYVYVGQFGSTKLKLNKYKIPYYEVMLLDECKKGTVFLEGNIARLCEPTTAYP